MMAAASIIVISDAAMSLDNVVALAAVSGGKFWLLAFGLVCTIPMIVFGSFGFTRLMQAFPLLVDAGAALLGWVAGGMIVGDPLFASWVKIQAPALDVAVPLACAIFVLLQGRFARDAAKAAPRVFRRRRFGLRRRRSLLRGRDRRAAGPRCRRRSRRQPAPAKSRRRPAAAPSADREEVAAEEGGDRWMFLGLAALFVVFGLFLLVVVMIPDQQQGAARQRHHFGGRQAVDRKSHLPVELQGLGLGVERVVAFRRAARALEGQGLAAPGAEIAFEPVLDLRAFGSNSRRRR